MNIKSKYYNFVTFFITIYFFFIGFITPFNFNGITPIPLLVSFILLFCIIFIFYKKSKLNYKSSILDILILLFLLESFISVLFNSFKYLNLNYYHLLAQFVVFTFYYFILKIAFYNSSYRLYNYILFGVEIAFWSISLIGIFDYFLRLYGINLEEIIPMPLSSTTVGSEIFIRAKGFFVEPGDFGMGINAFGPILISYYFNRRKNFIFITALFVFLTSLILCRSSAAFGFLILGILASFLINPRFYKFRITKYFTRIFFFALLGLISIYFYLYELLDSFQSDVFSKIFDDSSVSSSDRRASWSLMFDIFKKENIGKMLIGNGTGFVAGSKLTSLNWYLTILLENGLIGIFIILFIIIYSLRETLKINREIRIGFFISLFAVSAQLFTQTGFYYPVLWTLLAMITVLKEYNNRNYKSFAKV